MKKEIIEGNKLIAEFMGGKLMYYNISNEPYYLMPNKQQWMPERLVYHSSFDWLMPVVEKIECMGNVVKGIVIDGARVQIWTKDRATSTIDEFGNSKIEATWLAVVEFIKWYNQNKK